MASTMRLILPHPARNFLKPASLASTPSTAFFLSNLLPNQTRLFSSTSGNHARSSVSRMANLHAAIPPYPYGPARFFKQSNFGLYGGTSIQYGNIVSANMGLRNRRRWRPNVRQKRLWSDALQQFLRIRVTARALRTIDRSGGLDEYLLGEGKGRIRELGMGGWLLRWRIMQTEKVRERWRKERVAMGLAVEVDSDSDQGQVMDGLGEGEREAVEGLDREIQRVVSGAEEGGDGEFDGEEIVLGMEEDVSEGWETEPNLGNVERREQKTV